MFDEKMLYKILRYLLQATVIYLILRYTPYVSLDMSKALIITIILMIFDIALEYLYAKFYAAPEQEMKQEVKQEVKPEVKQEVKPEVKPEVKVEKFQGTNCDTCKVEKFTPTTTQPKCRVVCDGGDSKVEGFDPKTSTSVPPVLPHPSSMPPRPSVGIAPGPMPAPKPTGVAAVPPQQQEMVQEEMPPTDEKYYWGTRYGNQGYDNSAGFGGMFYDENPSYNRFNSSNLKNSLNTGSYLSDPEYEQQRQKREEVLVRDTANTIEYNARTTAGYPGPYQEPGAKSEKRKGLEHSRRIEGELDDELPYSDYNSLPIAAGYKSHEYEYGYSFLPPEKWYNQPVRSPVCITDHRAVVMPVFANGTPADVKEFHSSRRITPPDQISTAYISEKLNAGR